jgi:predicted nucleic acid-binding protein
VEPHRENAVKLRQDFLSGIAELNAPSFLVQEVANALWKAVKQKRTLLEDAQESLQMLNDLKIELVDVDWLQATEVLAIACKFDLAVYDAAYLFLAHETGACLITADNKLYEKAKEHYKILHIKDYPVS